jgi:hypothetical protein
VRGVVRGESNISDLKKKSTVIADAHDTKQLEFAIVPDFLDSGAIGDALHGITTIVHLASPLAVQVGANFFMILGKAVDLDDVDG